MNKVRPGTWERAINTCPTCFKNGIECYYARPACRRRKCLGCGRGKNCFPIPERDDHCKGVKKCLDEAEAKIKQHKEDRDDYVHWIESTQAVGELNVDQATCSHLNKVISHVSGMCYKDSFVQHQHERVQHMQGLQYPMFQPAGLTIEAGPSSFAGYPGPSSFMGSYAPPPAPGRLLLDNQLYATSSRGDSHHQQDESVHSSTRRRRSTTPPPSTIEAECPGDNDKHTLGKHACRK